MEKNNLLIQKYLGLKLLAENNEDIKEENCTVVLSIETMKKCKEASASLQSSHMETCYTSVL